MALKTILVLSAIFCVILMFLLFRTDKVQQPIEYIHNFTDNNKPPLNKLFNHNFNYVLNNHTICEGVNKTKLLAIIIVTSYFSNVEVRSAMRRAFPPKLLHQLHLQRVFLLALAPDDKYISQNAIQDEHKRFGDLIQGNFKEAYRNLTYKHLMGLNWVATYCKHAEYVIKMDDDTVINLYKVTELLQALKLPRVTIAGYILQGMVPKRDPANKWFVTSEEYRNSLYPTFVSGWFYITNPYTCEQLVKISTEVEYFWIDDIYVTGLLAEKLHIQHYNLGNYFTVHPEFMQCCMRDLKKFNYDCDILIGPNGGDTNLFYHFNEVMSKCFYKRCTQRPKSLNNTCVGERKFHLGKGSGIFEKLLLG